MARPARTPSTARVEAYKALLADILARRPSGTRQRLSVLLGKNPSFISQITNPAYDTPIPAQHVGALLDACHASPVERQDFMALYAAAHPRHFAVLDGGPKRVAHTLYLPDFGTAARNAQAARLLSEFVNNLASLMQQAQAPGGRNEETDE